MRSLRILLPAILILVITFVALAPCLKNGFVNQWDDDVYVRENAQVQNGSFQNVARVFTRFYAATYLPVTMLSYMLDYQLTGLDPTGYHRTSVLLHMLNALLVFWLIALLTRNSLVSFIAALLFGVHPLHVESVAWISERKDVLYAAFFLLSMIAYCYYSRARKIGWAYGLAVAFFLCSLLSKAMAVTLPLLLLLTDYFSGRARDRGMITDKIPFLLLALAFGLLGVLGQAPATQAGHALGFWGKFLCPSYSVFFYLGKILWPARLSSLYPFMGIDDLSGYLFSLGVFIGVLTLVLRSSQLSRKVAFGFFFFLITLLPVLQFVQMGFSIVADRYVYLASLGIFYLIAEAIAWGYAKIAAKSRRLGVCFVFFLLVLVTGGLTVLSRNRCAVWKDGLTLWSDALKNYPSAPGYGQRGLWLFGAGEYAKARDDFESAIATDPSFANSYLNLGILYKKEGKMSEALAMFVKAADVDPRNAEAYFNIANLYVLAGRPAEAMAYYERSLKITPEHPLCLYTTGLVLEMTGKKEEALGLLERALKANPENVPVYQALARLYSETGRENERSALYQKALQNDADFFEAYALTGGLYQSAGRYKEAMSLFKKAVAIDPASARAAAGLAAAYDALGRKEDALFWYKKALGMDPTLAAAYRGSAAADVDKKRQETAARQ